MDKERRPEWPILQGGKASEADMRQALRLARSGNIRCFLPKQSVPPLIFVFAEIDCMQQAHRMRYGD